LAVAPCQLKLFTWQQGTANLNVFLGGSPLPS